MPPNPGQSPEVSALVLKALGVGVWDYDIDADRLKCDASWYALLGVAPDSIASVGDFSPHVHPSDVETATSIDMDAVNDMIAYDRRYHVDFRIVRANDQAIRWWRSVASIVVDDQGHRRAVGCVTDMTAIRDFIAPGPEVERHTRRKPALPNLDLAPMDGDHLTEKELVCLRWVSLGKTAWETAVIMGRSRRTVEFHLLNAMRKLGAVNKVHAAVIAVRGNLI